MNIIDPHVHLFDLLQGDYHWLKPEKAPFWQDKSLIYQSFNESHLELKAPLNLAGFVHIEAGFDNNHPWREIAWLEQVVTLPFRSVAFLDITKDTESFEHDIAALSHHSSITGIRYILDEQAHALLTTPQVIRNLERIADMSWLFELHVEVIDKETVHAISQLCGESHLPDMVINHAGFPPDIAESGLWQQWCGHIKQLSQFEHISIKASGWEMSDRHYGWPWVASCLRVLINSFGIERVMFASNFPLTLFSHPYHQYWQGLTVQSALDNEQLTALCFSNANRVYKLGL